MLTQRQAKRKSTIPRYIVNVIEKVRDDVSTLDALLNKMDAIAVNTSENIYYSADIFWARLKIEPTYKPFGLLKEKIAQHQAVLKKQADLLEFIYHSRSEAEKAFEDFKILLISVLHSAAYAYCQYVKTVLDQQKNQKDFLEISCLVANVFSDGFQIAVNEQGEYQYRTVGDALNYSLIDLMRSLDEKLKMMLGLKRILKTEEKRSLAHDLEKVALKLLQEKIAEAGHQEDIMFCHDENEQGIFLSDNFSLFQDIVVACEDCDRLYNSSETISPSKMGVLRRNQHALAIEMNETNKLSGAVSVLSDLCERTTARLETESSGRQKLLETELKAYIEKVDLLLKDVSVTSKALADCFLQTDVDDRSGAYFSFQQIMSAVKNIKIGNEKHRIKEAIYGPGDCLRQAYGGKQLDVLWEQIQNQIDACAMRFNSALQDIKNFEIKHQQEIEKIKLEKRQLDLLELLARAILGNKTFWPLWNGISHYHLDGVQVPNGIKTSGMVFYEKQLKPVEKIKKILSIMNDRAKAGSKRFGLFTVRDDETTNRFYHAAGLIKRVETLTDAELENFKNELANIEGKNGKLNLTASCLLKQTLLHKSRVNCVVRGM